MHEAVVLVKGRPTLGSRRGTLNGPDATDVAIMMQALGEMHQVNVSLLISPGGELPDYSLLVIALAEQRVASAGGMKRSVSVKSFFPDKRSRTFEGALYRLMHELDVECSSLWVQEQFS